MMAIMRRLLRHQESPDVVIDVFRDDSVSLLRFMR